MAYAIYTDFKQVGMNLDNIEPTFELATKHAKELRKLGCDRVTVIGYESEAHAYKAWEAFQEKYQ